MGAILLSDGFSSEHWPFVKRTIHVRLMLAESADLGETRQPPLCMGAPRLSPNGTCQGKEGSGS